MKRFFYYIIASAVVLMAGCNTVKFEEEQPAVPDGEMVVRLFVEGPMRGAVRSYVNGTEASIRSIAMLCFDNEGKYIIKRDAQLTPQTATTGKLTGSVPANTCRIHFVANFDNLDVSGFTMGSLERAVMKNAALSSGITDEVRFWGYHTEATASAMENWLYGGNTVKFLRDRAKIVLVNEDSNISSIQWTVANGLNRGYVAPTCVSGNNPYDNSYVNSTRLTEYTTSGRYSTMSDTEAIWTVIREDVPDPQFVFENSNNSDNPLKVIVKATYSDNSVRYHTVILVDNDNVPFRVIRNQTFTLTIKKLPKALGSDNFSDALVSTNYSNNPYAQVSREVDNISNESFTLKVESVAKMFNQNGTAVIGFSYTGHDGGSVSGLSATNFDVSWEAKSDEDESDDVVAEGSNGVLTKPTVTYDSSTGEGTISFPLATLNDELKHNTFQIVAKNSGLSRVVDVYSITQFSFAATPTLSATSSTHTTGSGDEAESRKVYKLSFSLPSDFPESQYPLKVKLYTSTLTPFSDNSATSSHGSFKVVVASTSDLQESNTTSDWNYGAKSWGSYFEYEIESGKSFDIYLYENTANLVGRNFSTVGLYFQAESFGSMYALSQSYN